MDRLRTPRRRFLLSGTAVTAAAIAGSAIAQPATPQSPGPMRAGRGTDLRGKFAVVAGAARGIGRAIAVEMALNGADIAAIDICGPVSTASDAKPATPADLDETVRQVRGYGRRCIRIEADIRDIGKLREAAAHIQQEYGRIHIVVADAAIQRWKSLLEMEDSDWRDVIDNNLNGTANRYAPLHRYWSVSAMGESSSCPRCKASTGPKMPAHIRHRSGAFLG